MKKILFPFRIVGLNTEGCMEEHSFAFKLSGIYMTMHT